MSKWCKQWMLIHQTFNESGGPTLSTSPSTESWKWPKTSITRQAKRENSTNITCSTSRWPRKIDEQNDFCISVHTVVLFGDSCAPFSYTEKQLKDIDLRWCDANDNNSSVLVIDTTCVIVKLCNIRITETSYLSKWLGLI